MKLARIPFEKVWGGRALERAPGIRLELDGPVGETWELVDRDDHNSRVRGGPLDGRTLRSLLREAPDAILGRARPRADKSFPLLVKLLSASQALSVQVHPDDAAARELGAGDSGKCECWFVLAAEPGSVVHLGLKAGVDAARLAAGARGPGLEELLVAWPVGAGDFVFVPAGTVHSIGAGVTLVEVQQNSDLTYRVYDWGRNGLDGKPRALQLDAALRAIRFGAAPRGPVRPRLESRGEGAAGAELVDCEHFRVELLELADALELATGGVAVVYVATRGSGSIALDDAGRACALEPGDTCLVPAAAGTHRIGPRGGALQLLRIETKAG